MTPNRWEVPAKDLRLHFDPQQFPFATTEELPDLDGVIGQERAARSLEFGRQIRGLRIQSLRVRSTRHR
jgi:hypothetical protein